MTNLSNSTLNQTIYVGVDPGVSTGLAFWDGHLCKWELIKTTNIIVAMELILEAWEDDKIIEVVVEDARLVRYKTLAVRAQGAGSIKRDCSVWETFLRRHEIPHSFIRPKKAMTKLDASLFKKITKFEGQTSHHARDAAMLVFQRERK